MKHAYGRNAPPALALAVLLLTVMVLSTTPLALSKYVAVGTGSAKARLAMWEPSVGEFSDAFGKTIMIRNVSYNVPGPPHILGDGWISINDNAIADYTRENPANAAFTLQPSNAFCEVMTDYEWNITTNDSAWAMIIYMNYVNSAGSIANWGPATSLTSIGEYYTPGGVISDLNQMMNEPNYRKQVKPLETKDGLFVVMWLNTQWYPSFGGPSGYPYCYGKIDYTWTATQVD